MKPPKPKFHKKIFRELLSVGKYFLIIQIGAFIMMQADNLIVGKILGPSVLGVYVIARNACEIPLGMIRKIILRVALPVFSRIQNDKEKLSQTIEKLLEFQFAVIIPLAIFLALFAKPFIFTVYGLKWESAIPVLQVLMVVLLSQGVSQTIAPFFIGTGNFKFISKIKIIEVIVFLVAVYFGVSFFGVIGAALGAGCGSLLSTLIRISFICRRQNLSMLTLIGFINKPIVSLIPAITGGMYIMSRLDTEPFIQLVILAGYWTVTYIIMSLVVQKTLIDQIKGNIGQLLMKNAEA